MVSKTEEKENSELGRTRVTGFVLSIVFTLSNIELVAATDDHCLHPSLTPGHKKDFKRLKINKHNIICLLT